MISNDESIFLRNFVLNNDVDDDSSVSSLDLSAYALSANLNILKSDVHALLSLLLHRLNQTEAEKTALQTKTQGLENDLDASEVVIADLEARVDYLERAFNALTSGN